MKHRLKMYNPPHPAETIREDILPALGISVTQAAKQLGISRVTLSRLLNGKTGISADMAIRLHTWLGNDSPSPESWLHQQADYDLWQPKKSRPKSFPLTHKTPLRQPENGCLLFCTKTIKLRKSHNISHSTQ